MARQKYVLGALGVAAAGFLVAGMLSKPTVSDAMPTFAQAYGVACSACHTQVPLLNANGRYIQRTGYASLDRVVLARALPVWLDASTQYNSSAGTGVPLGPGQPNVPKYEFGNFAIHGIGYIAPDLTFHAQQWITSGGDSGPLDTFWVTYNHIFGRSGHLFFGKILSAAPSPYSMDFELDGASASSTLVGDHDWSGTYGNRWGTRFAYVRKSLDLEAGYYLSGDDLNGITDFNPGDKTLEWKAAYAQPNSPLEVGAFGSKGAVPLASGPGTDIYHSIAGYVQLDPSRYGRPGLFVVYQSGKDGNPGFDANGNPLGLTSSKGLSIAIFEHILHNAATIGYRHDLNDDGLGTVSNGNSINLAFNVPHFDYAHVFLEANTGSTSALAGGSNGPTWKGEFWLTLPIKAVH